MSGVISLKRLTKIVNRGASPVYDDFGTAKFINQACIYWTGVKELAIKPADESKHRPGSRGYLEKGDILVNSTGTGTLGRAAIFNKDNDGSYFADSHVTIVRPDPKILDSSYAKYFIQTDSFQDKIYTFCVSGSTNQIELSRERFRELELGGIEVHEQKKLADYLDTKTQTLDKILTAKNHTHTHLSELRQAIITNAVLGTGGATMSTSVKNTWVGATPDHWKITKLSHVARIKTGGTPSRENLDYWTDGNIPWLASGEVNKGIIATVDNHITPLGMANSNATILPIDTVMIALNGQGKTKGMAALLKVPATCNQSLAGVICDKDKINPRYLYYYLKSKYSNIRGIKGEARDGLNLDIIGSISVPLPPMEEQLAIIEQIERRINKIDKTEVKLSESIKLLEEYRSSLISNVVGGKVKI